MWKKNACSALTTKPSWASAAAGAASSRSGTLPNRSEAATRPAGVPGTPQEAAPMWNTCVESGVKWIGIGTAPTPRSRPSRPGHGDEEVEDNGLAPVVDEHVSTRAEPGRGALGHAGGQDGGDRGVDGVPALAQDARAGLRRQRMARGDDSPSAHARELRRAASRKRARCDGADSPAAGLNGPPAPCLLEKPRAAGLPGSATQASGARRGTSDSSGGDARLLVEDVGGEHRVERCA